MIRNLIRNLARLAWHLDEWLQEKLGRPYNAFLAVGIVLGLVHQLQDLPKDLTLRGGGGGLFVAAMDVALLINQAGQFHQHMERRKTMPRRHLLRRETKGDMIRRRLQERAERKAVGAEDHNDEG